MGGQGGKKKAFKAAAKKQPEAAAKKPEVKAKAVAKKQPAKPAAPIAKKAAKKEAKTEAEEEEEVEQLAEELAEKAPAKAAPKKTKARRLEEALQAMENAPDEEEDEDDDEEEGDKEEAGKAAGSSKAKKGKKGRKGEPRGVIYIGHLPRGFFEPQLRKFFSQFGKVTRLRLSRSKKNAQSKGYAFIEFEDEAVAKIVADTMTKYLLFGKQLVCHVVAPEKIHPATFKGCRKRMVNFQPRRRRQAREAYNKRPMIEVDGESVPQTTDRQVSRRNRSEKKLKSMLVSLGVDYDPSMAASSTAGAADKPAQGKKRKAEEATEKKAVPEKAAPAKGPAGGKAAKAKAKNKSK